MSRRILALLSLTSGVALLLAQALVGPLGPSRGQSPLAAPSTAAQHAAMQSQYGHLPLAFELNVGQVASPARFLAHGAGYTLALTPSEALLSLSHGAPTSTPRSPITLPGYLAPSTQSTTPPTLLGMRWLGANPQPVVSGEQPLAGTVNYFIGNNPSQWHTNIPTYQQVRLHDIYPGIDLLYYGNAGQLEYDFVVAPAANPAAVQLGFTGAQGLGVDLLGNLSLTLPGGPLQQAKPLVYQIVNGAREVVAGSYTVMANQHVGFALGAYNPHLPLVIDPVYKFSTYLGGSHEDDALSMALDGTGNIYVTGGTQSNNFPTANAPQPSFAGKVDAFVTKLNAAGTALVYSTYLGGSGVDWGQGIAVDTNGNAYITGYTNSTDFPIVGALQAHNGGGGNNDAIVSKLNATGTALVYSTYLGGTQDDFGISIAVDTSGDMFVTGATFSNDFPIHDPLQATLIGAESAFVSELNAGGSSLTYSTYLGGGTGDRGEGIAVDASGNTYVTGVTFSPSFPTVNPFQANLNGDSDAFVSKLNTTGSALIYSTYLGGSGDETGFAIALDDSGNAYVAGFSSSDDFTTTSGALQTGYGGGDDAFVTKIDAAGNALIYSSYLGGSSWDEAFGIAVDESGNAYVIGFTLSTNFPTQNPLQATNGSGNAFVSELNSAGSTLIYSSYLGGSIGEVGHGIAVGSDATVYVVGDSSSSNFPTINALQPTAGGFGDAFVTKFTTYSSVDTTTGVFRPANGTLYLKNANTTGPADITLAYGLPGDLPITGDWTGKGYKSIGIYRNGTFYLRNSNTTGYADITVAFGASTDIPVAGDWTGKGYDSIGVYRPSNSTFYLRDSNTSGTPDHVVTLGISGDVPIVGDWTGKGWDSVGVFRPSNGIVYLRNSNTTGYADINFVYGIAGDKPVVGDWTAQGKDTIGVDRGGHFLLRNSNTTGPANLSFYLGVNGDDPIAGPWLAPVGGVPPVQRGPRTPLAHTATMPTRRGATAR